MIQANELRIGNWVKENYDIGNNFSRYSIVDIDLLDDILNGYNPLEFEPIPLTPEILTNSGFVIDRTGWVYDEFRIRLRFKTPKQDEFDLVFHPFVDYIGGDRIIKSVHQLQNLYFALTGTELSVNIETSIQHEKS